MTTKILSNKPRPHKHRALADDLRILAVSLAPGDRMPSVPELVREYGVAPSTAQAAVETLRREGVVVRRRGSGTFVAERSAAAGSGAHPT
jgi:GntR family transcriptional regulator